MCQATVKGRQCKRKQEPYCYQHKPTGFVFPVEPSPELADKYKKRIERVIKKGPTKTDGPGWIYVYFVESDKSDTFYKIGRTARTVTARLKEWGPECVLHYSAPVKSQKMAETLIHAYLAHLRVFRYKQKDGSYESVWMATGKPVLSEGNPSAVKSARCKEIEWFSSNWKTIGPVVDTLCKMLF